MTEAAQYAPTDFAGAFTPGTFFDTDPGSRPLGPVVVETIGALVVTSGRLVLWDVLDRTYLDKTIQPLAQRVPTGSFDVELSRWEDVPLAARVCFASRAVDRWVLAELDVPLAPSNAMPWLPIANVRFAIGLADAGLVDEIMNAVMVEESAEQAAVMRGLFGESPREGPPPRSPDGSHAALDAMREQLDSGREYAATAGMIGIRGASYAIGWSGLDASGNVVALALDFGRLRRHTSDEIDVPIHDALARRIVRVRDVSLLGVSPTKIHLEILRASRFGKLRIVDAAGRDVSSGSIHYASKGNELTVRLGSPMPSDARLRFAFAKPTTPAPRVQPTSRR